MNKEFREGLYEKGTFELRPRIPVAEVLVQKIFKFLGSRKDPSGQEPAKLGREWNKMMLET